MRAHPYSAARLIELHGVQGKLHDLQIERDDLIVKLDGFVGVRELARFLGISPAQVSRIRKAARGEGPS